MSAISDRAAQAVAAIEAFAQVLPGALAAKAQEAYQADNANALQGNSFSSMGTQMDAELTTHLAATPDPHGLTLAQINAYSQAQVNAKLGSPLIPNAALPISRYGELSYLPVSVSGSFEGATTNWGNKMADRYYPCMVEADGTLVYLRNGTNGSKSGVYYAYSKNALNAGALGIPTRTNTKYQPAYFPSGYTASYVWKSDENVIWGRLQDSSGTLGQMFISLTGGTYDQSNHVGAVFDIATISVASDGTSYPEAFLAGSNVVLVVPGRSVYNLPVEFSIYTIPVSAIQAGGTVTPTQVTGWTTQAMYGAYSGNTIRIAGMQSSPNASDQPLVRYDNTVLTNPNIYPFHNAANTFDIQSAYDPVSGNCRTRLTGLYWIQNQNNGQTTQLWQIYSWTWNIGTKQASLDAGLAGNPGLATLDGNGNLSVSGPGMNGNKQSVGPNNFQTGDNKYYHAASSKWFSVNDSSQPDYPVYLSRIALSTPGLSKYAALLYNQATNSGQSSQIGFYPAYGSAIGATLQGSYQLPGNRLLVSTTGLTQSGNIARYLAIAQRGAAGWTYGSASNGSYTGYAPTTYRYIISDLGLTQATYTGLISEINSAGTVSATGNSYVEGVQTQGFLSCDQNLATSNPVAISASAASALKAAIFAQAGVATPTDSKISIFVPQNANVPPWATVHYIQTGGWESVIFAELSITAGSRTSNITGFGIVSLSPIQNLVQFPLGSTLGTDANQSCIYGGQTVYEVSDAYLVGGSGKHQASRPGWSGAFTHRFAVPKSTNRPDWTTLVVQPYWMVFDTQYYTAVPGVGFGMNYQRLLNSPGNADSDYYTKLLFIPMATDLASFKTWAVPAKTSWQVQVSQDVAQGWIVYFTDNTPLILGGKYTVLPPSNIDLTTVQANPANTTFYVYVVMNAGVASYQITTAPQAESSTRMYIGKLTTGASSIQSIAMQKVSRLDKFRVSTTSAGGAISASTGTPDAAGHLNWT